MNKLPILIFLYLISCKSSKQQSFEGLIKFSTEVTTAEFSPEGSQKQMEDKYGDSLMMYYSKTGDFLRVHLNSSEFGADSQIYIAKEGKIYFTNKNNEQLDSLNTKENSLKLIDRKKIDNVRIINLDCDCFEYKAISVYNQNVTLNYCYSSRSPKIDYELFFKHKDFYLNDFYKIAKRPYLKFSIETDSFKITYLATELIEMEIEKEKFSIR